MELNKSQQNGGLIVAQTPWLAKSTMISSTKDYEIRCFINILPSWCTFKNSLKYLHQICRTETGVAKMTVICKLLNKYIPNYWCVLTLVVLHNIITAFSPHLSQTFSTPCYDVIMTIYSYINYFIVHESRSSIFILPNFIVPPSEMLFL